MSGGATAGDELADTGLVGASVSCDAAGPAAAAAAGDDDDEDAGDSTPTPQSHADEVKHYTTRFLSVSVDPSLKTQQRRRTW